MQFPHDSVPMNDQPQSTTEPNPLEESHASQAVMAYIDATAVAASNALQSLLTGFMCRSLPSQNNFPWLLSFSTARVSAIIRSPFASV
jgi:hypothetical protein